MSCKKLWNAATNLMPVNATTTESWWDRHSGRITSEGSVHQTLKPNLFDFVEIGCFFNDLRIKFVVLLYKMSSIYCYSVQSLLPIIVPLFKKKYYLLCFTDSINLASCSFISYHSEVTQKWQKKKTILTVPPTKTGYHDYHLFSMISSCVRFSILNLLPTPLNPCFKHDHQFTCFYLGIIFSRKVKHGTSGVLRSDRCWTVKVAAKRHRIVKKAACRRAVKHRQIHHWFRQTPFVDCCFNSHIFSVISVYFSAMRVQCLYQQLCKKTRKNKTI